MISSIYFTGFKFVRGVILYGPPGTGKTTIIRELCEYFKYKPKVINGPQLLNSLIGKSEEAVRLLFEKAKKDQKNKGDSSPLHVIVFEEIDALFSKRTSSEGGSDTRNGIVNQLLTMMDGYDALNNILIFGTTNRLDMIDPALLRGGRFELQVKIDLPNVQERLEIFNYHLNEPRKNGFLASNISTDNFQQLASVTNNYSGADIAELVRLAISYAIDRSFEDTTTSLDKLNLEHANICIQWNDLITAFYQCEQARRKRENELKTNKNNANDDRTDHN
ncbi:unnamed protein product [Rotaria sordida]|uniref:Vesicle-fusing ATPase n=1 Tax=Rotaria sordida TaxID=392033 RepID=A0A815GEJ2_9BILA|nr:unnamed protein product [Rotaria sordida]CAF1375587.1 unnamed protein product [Rotaria sordida]CAF1424914.1 unnamed protein product [Rotaria sordida]CAF1455441.1 unnamed protein product [Rotaria sordida]CAF1595081.1 unnamed protein product [Rotaria sordida]